MDDVDDLLDVFLPYPINTADESFDVAREVVAHEQSGLQSTVGQLEEKVGHLALICRALFELLQRTAGVSERDLAAKITEIDLRDGKADGRMTPQPKLCPSCGSMISPKFNRCLFCGYRDQSGDPFNPVN